MADMLIPNTLVIELAGGPWCWSRCCRTWPRHVEQIKGAGPGGRVRQCRVPSGDSGHGPDRRRRPWRHGRRVQHQSRGHRRVEPTEPAGRVLEVAVRPRRGRHGAARTNSGNSRSSSCSWTGISLNGQYTASGEGVIAGMEHVDAITRGEPPRSPDRMISVKGGGPTNDPACFPSRSSRCSLVSTAATADQEFMVIEVNGKATGTIEIQLLPDVAPEACRPNQALTNKALITTSRSIKVIEGFMAPDRRRGIRHQGGLCPGKAEDGGSTLADLPAGSRIPFRRGTVGMAAPRIRTAPIRSSSSRSSPRRSSTDNIPWWAR